MSNPLLAFFQQIPLFSVLDESELNDIIRAVQPRPLAAGQALFNEGDEGDGAYVIQSGKIGVYIKLPDAGETQVNTCGPGEVIGDIALLDGSPRSATCRALEDSQLMHLDGREFDMIRKNYRPAAYKLIREITLTVCERLRQNNEKVSAILSSEPPVAGAPAPAAAPASTATPAARPPKPTTSAARPPADRPGLLGKLFRKKGKG